MNEEKGMAMIWWMIVSAVIAAAVIGVGLKLTIWSGTKGQDIIEGTFTVTPNSSSITIPKGEAESVQITVDSPLGYNKTVTLSISGQPSGVTANLNPVSGTPTFTSTLTLTVDSEASVGDYTLSIIGTGTDQKTATSTFTLSVL